ncbi:MAG: DUF4410 domain-containing protein [Candidatus Omnitrophota bacterium]
MRTHVKIAVVFWVWLFMMIYFVAGEGVAAAAAEAVSNVYVADFTIDQESQDQEDASGESLLERVRPRILENVKEERAELRREDLIALLSRFLVNDLNEKGISASRLTAADELGQEGILVQGEFMKMDEGDPLKRAAVGLNTGATDMEVKVMISSLPLDENKTSDELDLKSSSASKGPGGVLGLAVCGNPYVLAAKFVMAKHTSEQDVRKLASQIADEIQHYLEK